jgi:presenilin-like A22 family membrane protease
MVRLCRLTGVDPAAVWTITFHVLEVVAVVVVLLLYLLIKVWRRI